MPRTVELIHVAAGILRDADGRVLLTERVNDRQFAGLWEFPGGKLDAGESREAALARELAEELGVEISRFEHFMSVDHEYPGRRVRIEFFLVTAWNNAVQGVLGQQFRWVAADRLVVQEMLPANVVIVEALQRIHREG